MIAASAVLVLVAFVSLILGIFQDGLGLIWVSIASSVLAAIFLLLGVVRGRPPKSATAAAPQPGTWGDASATAYTEPVVETEPELAWDDTTGVLEQPVAFEPEEIMPPRRAATTRPSTSRATTKRPSTASARSAASSRSAASRTGAAASRAAKAPAPRVPAAQMPVVVIPDRDKFHKGTCRYAKTAGAMKMTKSEARREGYKACGVCKP